MKALKYVYYIIVSILLVNSSYLVAEDFRVNDDYSNSYQGYSNIASDLDGNFVISWYDKRNGNHDIYLQMFTHTGGRTGVNNRINDDPGTDEQIRPSLMKDQAGNFTVCWQDYRNNGYPLNADIFAQRFNQTGVPQLVNFKINSDFGTETQAWQDIGNDDFGNYVIVWEDGRNGNYDIYAQRYHKSGVALGVNFRVNDDLSPAYQHNPKICVDGDGDFVIVWYDNRSGIDNIMAQRYNSAGVKQGSNFLINTITGSTKHVLPDVACDYNGNFMVAWIDYRNGTYPSNPDVYGRMYWADGTSRSSEFKINNDAAGNVQAEVCIGMDFVGNHIVAWRDDRNGNYDIFAQYYNQAGTKPDGNYKVNSDNGTAVQSFPNVAMDGINIYMTWTDQRNGNFDVYAIITEYGAPSIVATPLALEFQAELGGSQPAAQELFITNVGYGVLQYQAQTNVSWLSVLPQTGNAPETLIVAVNTSGLEYGNHEGRITISDVSGQDSARVVVISLDLLAPELSINPTVINIDAIYGFPLPNDKFVQIENSSIGSLSWQIVDTVDWLDFSSESGSAPALVDLIFNQDFLDVPGNYSAIVEVTSADAINSPQNFEVNLNLEATTPIIATDLDTLHFILTVTDSVVNAQQLLIYNIGIDFLNWSLTDQVDWLEYNPEFSIGDALVDVSIIPHSLEVGEYYTTLTISDQSAINSPVDVIVHAIVFDAPPVIVVDPDTLSFLCYYNGPQDDPQEITVSNLGGGEMNWSVRGGVIWLALDSEEGIDDLIITASVQTAGLPISEYSTWLYFDAPVASNLIDSVFVLLSIKEWLPKICLEKDTIKFIAREGLDFSDNLDLIIESCGAPGLDWQVSESIDWLTTDPSSGVDSDTISMTLNLSAPAIEYSYQQLLINSTTAENSPKTVTVVLDVKPLDQLQISSTITEAGSDFQLDLTLTNFLPFDSIKIDIDFDTLLFQIDSFYTASYLQGIMELIFDSDSSSLVGSNNTEMIPSGNGLIATLYFSSKDYTPEGEYFVNIAGSLRDSLGLITPLEEKIGYVDISATTAVNEIQTPILPNQFQLHQNYPNPFNDNTIISYSLNRTEYIEIEVFNITGQVVNTLYYGVHPVGSYFINWNATDKNNESLGSGIYFIRLKSASESQIIKAAYLK